MKFIFALILFAGQPFGEAFAATKVVDVSQIQTNFDPMAQLSQAEMRSVVQLAQRYGIKKVARIETYNIHPGPDFSIQVVSPETVRGREVSYVTVDIRRGQWTANKPNRPPPNYRRIGDFTIDPNDLYTIHVTTFALNKQTVRMEVSNVPLAVADKIVAAFANGKIRFSDPTLSVKYGGVGILSANALYARDNHQKRQPEYTICFSVGYLHGRSVSFRLEGDTVVVFGIMDAMA
jgi:hypothetical protein